MVRESCFPDDHSPDRFVELRIPLVGFEQWHNLPDIEVHMAGFDVITEGIMTQYIE